MDTNRRQNPWRMLRERPHLKLEYDDLQSLDGCIRGNVITLRSDLDQRERNAVLMHELIHDERGITYPAATWALMEHEEEQVRREVVRRLVPLDQLRTYLERHGAALVHEVADHFEVPDWLAAEALRSLRVWRAA